MSRDDNWLLPDGVEEVLPQRAAVIEQLRRRLLDQFQRWGYELVFPPLIEFLEPLLKGAGGDLERETFKITDQLTGRLMGVRADITPQVARMDAHSLRREGITRLCYCSTALRTRAAQPGGTRLPYQIGVELFGHAGLDSDAEVICLLVESLQAAGVSSFTLELGHVGIYRALVAAAGLQGEDEEALFDAYVRKSRADIDAIVDALSLDVAVADALRLLPWLTGDSKVLARARDALGALSADIVAAIDEVAALAALVGDRYPGVSLHLDLGELRGYHYHTGCLFTAYLPGISEPLAKGGRYDHIGEVFGRARPATGFSADLKLLADRQPAVACQGILAQGDLRDAAFAETVSVFRSKGERVVLVPAGARADATELQCDRRLVLQGDEWVVESL